MSSDDSWDGEWDEAPPWAPISPRADDPDVELVEMLSSALGGISERHADVVRRRLGLGESGWQTLQEIGVDLGVSRERVRQLQVKALARLRGSVRLAEVGSAAHQVTVRIEAASRALRSHERGAYFRNTFPEAEPSVLGRTLGAFTKAFGETEVLDWIASYEEVAYRDQREARDAARTEERLGRFLSAPLVGKGAQWKRFSPSREVRTEGGAFRSEKVGRDVQFESGLEKQFLLLLDASPTILDFCEQPFSIDYPWFDRRRSYFPDVAVQLSSGECLLVELKPRSLWAEAMNLAKWNAATRWCEKSGWTFVVSDGRTTPNDVARLANSDDFRVLEHVTESGPAYWSDLESTWFSKGRSWMQLVGACLRYGFALQRGPLVLRRARNSPWLNALCLPE